MAYGLVKWYLNVSRYDWDDKIDVGNTLEKTTNQSIDNVYDEIIDFAINNARTDEEKKKLKYLKRQNRNFIINHKTDIEDDSIFQNDIKEKFQSEIRQTSQTELEKYRISQPTKEKIMLEFVSNFEDVKLSRLPREIEKKVEEVWEEEFKEEKLNPLVRQATEEILGRTIATEDELNEARINKEITWGEYLKIRNRIKSIALG